MHWATFRATIRRSGVFRDHDFNENLAQPLLDTTSASWNAVFNEEIPQSLEKFKSLIEAKLGGMMTGIQKVFEDQGFPDMLGTISQSATATFSLNVDAIADSISRIIVENQRIASRRTIDVVRDKMELGYSRGNTESGTGCVQR